MQKSKPSHSRSKSTFPLWAEGLPPPPRPA
jgi:hypothetical protein